MFGGRRLLVALVLFPGVLMGQSLGEVAKKEKKRREQNKEKGVEVRLVEEDRVRTVESGDTEADEDEATSEGEPPSSAVDVEASGPSRDTAASDRRREEAEWRRRIGEARTRLRTAEERYNQLKDLHLVHGEHYVDENGQPVIRSLGELRRVVDEAKVELDAAASAMEQLREEARRAGVPPGWFR